MGDREGNKKGRGNKKCLRKLEKRNGSLWYEEK